MKLWHGLCVLAGVCAFFANTGEARADVAGNSYVAYVATEKEDGAVALSFTANTFLVVTDIGDFGGGTFNETGGFVSFVSATGVGEGYIGTFNATAIGNNFIIGVGIGSDSKVFWFVGI